MPEPKRGKAPFVKMHGAGNDFVAFDARVLESPLRDEIVRALCDRRRGIGADGVLVVTPVSATHLRVDYLNRDGGPAFCGNGTRCAVRFARDRNLLEEHAIVLAGSLTLRVVDQAGAVRVEMPEPVLDASPLALAPFDGSLDEGWRVRVGVPHLVVRVVDTESVDVARRGALLRQAPFLGAEGANVNFVEERGPSRLRVRTFERGVEAETLACGTGAVAAAAWHAAGRTPWECQVETRGGDVLVVRRDAEATWLEGPAEESYEGEIDLGAIVRR